MSLAEVLGSPPWNTLCTVHYAREAVREWTQQSERQCNHVRLAIAQARSMGFTHLLHIDDDELIYLPSGHSALQTSLLSLLRDRPSGGKDDDVCEFHLLTLEAIAPSLECDNAFAECCAFRHCASDFASYGSGNLSHGKSIGLLAVDSLAPSSPHHFKTTAAEYTVAGTVTLPPPVGVILHYESCTYTRWYDKFADMAAQLVRHGVNAVQHAVSFTKFYRASVECHARLLKNPTASNEHTAKETWCSAKLEPLTVSALRPIEFQRTFGRLTLIPPPAASVVDEKLSAVERNLEATYLLPRTALSSVGPGYLTGYPESHNPQATIAGGTLSGKRIAANTT